MRLESKTYLHDVQQAARLTADFVAGKSFADYQSDAMLRAAVEREFTIIGEAIARLASRDPSLASRISQYERIIAFRNVLIHGYAAVDDALVWDVLESELPTLANEVEALLAEE